MNILEHIGQRTLLPLSLWGIDISVSNGVIMIWLAVAASFFFFFFASRRPSLVPGKLQNMAEMGILFLRDEVLSEIPEDREKWLPFIVALFSFILFNNLLGLVPGMSGATANINTTAALAIIVFIVVQFAGIIKQGISGYFRSFLPRGIPLPVMIFMIPIEFISQLARPFSLSVRLFANMYAGHAVTLMLLSLIFLFRSYLIIPLPVIGSALILAFEIFVAAIQAFIFTYLSALYIGLALSEH
ncbi:MAG: F0F1 ATP synthase subunit A [Candidatus Saganbacteria bacterium]|nr:F0F1 ATP synthase subunit A [Candidatus Saganbacteria bacterium]